MEILSGPFGTELKRKGRKELVNPATVLSDELAKEARFELARDYFNAGAGVRTADTFGLRYVLRHGTKADYTKAIDIHHDIVSSATGGHEVTFSFGPYGDCYIPDEAPGILEAIDFHSAQLDVAKNYPASVLFETICSVREAIGIALASKRAGVQSLLSFVVGADGRILDGESLESAIRVIDAEADGAIKFFGANCCKLEDGVKALHGSGSLVHRMGIFYPNASDLDLIDLENSTEIQGLKDREERARILKETKAKFRNLEIIGGCCGHNHEDIGAFVRKFAA